MSCGATQANELVGGKCMGCTALIDKAEDMCLTHVAHERVTYQVRQRVGHQGMVGASALQQTSTRATEFISTLRRQFKWMADQCACCVSTDIADESCSDKPQSGEQSVLHSCLS